MKNSKFKNAIITAVGISFGMVLYDWLFGESINWTQAAIALIVVLLVLMAIKQFFGKG